MLSPSVGLEMPAAHVRDLPRTKTEREDTES
jgi:hypothetical protein